MSKERADQRLAGAVMTKVPRMQVRSENVPITGTLVGHFVLTVSKAPTPIIKSDNTLT
jgi:hypothetical protein